MQSYSFLHFLKENPGYKFSILKTRQRTNFHLENPEIKGKETYEMEG